MGRARVVAPPPKDYVPEPLVAPPIIEEQQSVDAWMDGNLSEMLEQIAANEPSEEELEKERIAQQRHEEILQKKKEESERLAKIEEEKRIALEEAEKAKRLLEEEKDRLAAIAHEQLQQKKAQELTREKLSKKDRKESKVNAELAAELEELRRQNEELTRQKEAAEKAREEQILKARQQATEQRGSQLNIVQARKPSIKSRVKDFFKRRRIQLATVPRGNYEQAIIHQASVAVPKMLDDIEKMHERLTILEELLVKHKERQKIKD